MRTKFSRYHLVNLITAFFDTGYDILAECGQRAEITSVSRFTDGIKKLRFSGTGFSDTDLVEVNTLSADNCEISGADLICDEPNGLGTGQHDIKITGHTGIGTVANGVYVNIPLSLDSITPAVGSRFGGLPVTVTGSGFDKDTIFSFIQNGAYLCSPCAILEMRSGNEFVIQTPSSGTDGAAKEK